MAKDILCPYCINKLDSSLIQYICPICGTAVAPTKRELLLKKLPRCKNEGCHNAEATGKRCWSEECHAELPPDILSYKKYLRFSLLGVAGAGKTNYLTALLHEIRNSSVTPWVFSPMSVATRDVYDANVQSIYADHIPAPATIAGAPPIPQQWRVTDKSKIKAKDIPAYSLTIFDGAGEDISNIDPVISRYISGSKTLIILIDPLSLPEVRKSVSDEIVSRSATAVHEEGKSANMVDGLANYIRISCGMKPNQLIDRDVAVVFTKIDAVRQSFGTATVMQPSPHLAKKGFVKSDGEAVDAEIRDWLSDHNEHSFLNALDTNFVSKKVQMFGVSSFGQLPTGDSQLGKVVPHRVLDPIIWMFSKEGIAPVI